VPFCALFGAQQEDFDIYEESAVCHHSQSSGPHKLDRSSVIEALLTLLSDSCASSSLLPRKTTPYNDDLTLHLLLCTCLPSASLCLLAPQRSSSWSLVLRVGFRLPADFATNDQAHAAVARQPAHRRAVTCTRQRRTTDRADANSAHTTAPVRPACRLSRPVPFWLVATFVQARRPVLLARAGPQKAIRDVETRGPNGRTHSNTELQSRLASCRLLRPPVALLLGRAFLPLRWISLEPNRPPLPAAAAASTYTRTERQGAQGGGRGRWRREMEQRCNQSHPACTTQQLQQRRPDNQILEPPRPHLPRYDHVQRREDQ
jgi:hypothetical protein